MMIHRMDGGLLWRDLARLDASWCYIFAGDERNLDFLVEELRRGDFPGTAKIVRGSRSHTFTDFFAEWAAALQLPYYFSSNWSSFNECLNDLEEWMPSPAYFLFLSGTEEILVDEPFEHFQTLIRILEGAAREWLQPEPTDATSPSGIPFRVVFQGEDEELCRARLSHAGVFADPLPLVSTRDDSAS